MLLIEENAIERFYKDTWWWGIIGLEINKISCIDAAFE